MFFPISARAAAVCAIGLLMGNASAASGQLSGDCIPNPIEPGSCLGIESLMSGVAGRNERSDARSYPARTREDTPRARVRDGQRPTSLNPPSSIVSRSNASSRPSATQKGSAAVAGAVAGAPAGRISSKPSTAAPTAVSKPTRSAPMNASAQERARARAQR